MLGEKLKQLREEKGMTQKNIADMLGISQPAYARYENNEREPNLETLIKLCNYFNISADELLNI